MVYPSPASRKFVELIQGATSKWANWDPPNKIAVGDYGVVHNETGEFDYEGNIYSPHFLEQLQSSNYKVDFDLSDPALRPQELSELNDNLIVSSQGVTIKKTDVSSGVWVLLHGVSGTALKLDMQFHSNKRAAVLVMHKPRYSHLPNDERIIRLLDSIHYILKGKYIVTEVVSCAAYMMYLSGQSNFSVTLTTTGPVAPAATARGAVGFVWPSQGTHGISRQGSDPTAGYVPLYKLKKARSKFQLWLSGHRGDGGFNR
ncbi:hypothetical protein EDB19DRAFT_1643113 [Suillus lakei]|nr:hypothetical protein EDB19DRAFT_1643113 [Suillus lakei]